MPFEEESFIPNASLVRVGYRSFDRQWVIADSRLIHDCRRPLWEARLPGQVYLAEQHSFHPKRGPGLAFSGLLPDMHHFNGRGGRVLPMLNPDGSSNLASGLFEALSAQLDGEIAAPDVTSYVAGITGHPGFVETFDEELRTPGIRVPITADRMLWKRAVELGRKVLLCHTYGLAGEWPGQESVVSPLDGVELPRYERRMGSSLPTGPAVYDESSQELRLGAGVWSHVTCLLYTSDAADE